MGPPTEDRFQCLSCLLKVNTVIHETTVKLPKAKALGGKPLLGRNISHSLPRSLATALRCLAYCSLGMQGAANGPQCSILSNIMSSSQELSIRETAELSLSPDHLVHISDRFSTLVKSGGTSSLRRPLLCFKVVFISVKSVGTCVQRLPSNPKAAPLLCLPTQLNYKPLQP